MCSGDCPSSSRWTINVPWSQPVIPLKVDREPCLGRSAGRQALTRPRMALPWWQNSVIWRARRGNGEICPEPQKNCAGLLNIWMSPSQNAIISGIQTVVTHNWRSAPSPNPLIGGEGQQWWDGACWQLLPPQRSSPYSAFGLALTPNLN